MNGEPPPAGRTMQGARLLADPEPARHNDIRPLFQNVRQGIGMKIPAIRDGDIAFGKGCAIKPLTTFLIGQLDKAKALGGQIEGAMKPAIGCCFSLLLSQPWERLSIEEPDAPATCRRHGPGNEQRTYEVFHPGAAFTQALEQSDVGKVREAGRCGPCACRSQPHAAQAIGQDEPQQIGCAAYPRARRKAPISRAEASMAAVPPAGPALSAKVRSKAIRASCHA